MSGVIAVSARQACSDTCRRASASEAETRENQPPRVLTASQRKSEKKSGMLLKRMGSQPRRDYCLPTKLACKIITKYKIVSNTSDPMSQVETRTTLANLNSRTNKTQIIASLTPMQKLQKYRGAAVSCWCC